VAGDDSEEEIDTQETEENVWLRQPAPLEVTKKEIDLGTTGGNYFATSRSASGRRNGGGARINLFIQNLEDWEPIVSAHFVDPVHDLSKHIESSISDVSLIYLR
jgi:hypothetical protein